MILRSFLRLDIYLAQQVSLGCKCDMEPCAPDDHKKFLSNFVNTDIGIMLEPLLILCFQSHTYQMPPKHGLSGVAGYNQQMKPKKHKNPW